MLDFVYGEKKNSIFRAPSSACSWGGVEKSFVGRLTTTWTTWRSRPLKIQDMLGGMTPPRGAEPPLRGNSTARALWLKVGDCVEKLAHPCISVRGISCLLEKISFSKRKRRPRGPVFQDVGAGVFGSHHVFRNVWLLHGMHVGRSALRFALCTSAWVITRQEWTPYSIRPFGGLLEL